MRRILSVLVLTALLAACGSEVSTDPKVIAAQKATAAQQRQKVLEISGETMYATPHRLADLNKAYVPGCKAKAIARERCNDFRALVLRMQKDYPPAVRAWEIAVDANDDIGAKAARQIVFKMAGELALLAVDITKADPVPVDAPVVTTPPAAIKAPGGTK